MVENGRKSAAGISIRLKKDFSKLPRLTVGAVLVGENPASMSFLKQKSKIAQTLGAGFEVYKFKSKIKTAELISEIKKLNRKKNISGLIVQLPLPRQINAKKVLEAINPKKDIDALSKNPLVSAPTVEALKFVLQKYRVNPRNKNVLIVGKGRLVGKPIYDWLKPQARVKAIDIKQKNQLPDLAQKAGIIVSGAGKAELINGKMIKKGAVLIDFGFSRKNGKIKGDFEFESCAKKAKLITPVPGGMGPIAVVMLFKNLLKLSKL